jgi:hypothetical protein
MQPGGSWATMWLRDLAIVIDWDAKPPLFIDMMTILDWLAEIGFPRKTGDSRTR